VKIDPSIRVWNNLTPVPVQNSNSADAFDWKSEDFTLLSRSLSKQCGNERRSGCAAECYPDPRGSPRRVAPRRLSKPEEAVLEYELDPENLSKRL
jgi:hypothetical protein